MAAQHIVTLANSIVGVSVLAMPFCFRECGIILATLILIIGAILTRLVCHFLLKSSIIAKRRTFELLAFHTFGPGGKFLVEITIIGYLVGTLIAFLVVMGDLGPQIVTEFFGIENDTSLRSIVMAGLALFVALPLGLLRNIDSLSSVSTASAFFYTFLAGKLLSESITPLLSGSYLSQVNYWRPSGLLQCIPIFSMALSCQTQIFSIYEILPEPSIVKMNSVIKSAVYTCTGFYIIVGILGYIGFYSVNGFGGNVLLTFSPNWSTQLIKVCFLLSVAFSFPIVILPCRASLNSLIYKGAYTPLHHQEDYIPETRIKFLTIIIIGVTLVMGLIIPNIELVLGLVGSTCGSVICIICPTIMFIRVTNKNNIERVLAQAIFCLGVIILITTTYATLYAVEKAEIERNIPIPTIEHPAAIVSQKHSTVANEMQPVFTKNTSNIFVPEEFIQKLNEQNAEQKKILEQQKIILAKFEEHHREDLERAEKESKVKLDKEIEEKEKELQSAAAEKPGQDTHDQSKNLEDDQLVKNVVDVKDTVQMQVHYTEQKLDTGHANIKEKKDPIPIPVKDMENQVPDTDRGLDPDPPLKDNANKEQQKLESSVKEGVDKKFEKLELNQNKFEPVEPSAIEPKPKVEVQKQEHIQKIADGILLKDPIIQNQRGAGGVVGVQIERKIYQIDLKSDKIKNIGTNEQEPEIKQHRKFNTPGNGKLSSAVQQEHEQVKGKENINRQPQTSNLKEPSVKMIEEHDRSLPKQDPIPIIQIDPESLVKSNQGEGVFGQNKVDKPQAKLVPEVAQVQNQNQNENVKQIIKAKIKEEHDKLKHLEKEKPFENIPVLILDKNFPVPIDKVQSADVPEPVLNAPVVDSVLVPPVPVKLNVPIEEVRKVFQVPNPANERKVPITKGKVIQQEIVKKTEHEDEM